MDREILFRGKRVDNGEWVEGYFVSLGDKHHYILTGKFNLTNNFPNFEHFNVSLTTVGQYTGLTDKNGRRIFEGDIIKTKKYGRDTGRSNVNDFDFFIVIYEPSSFFLDNKNRRFILADDGFSNFEIIDNIHDNPEMLGGETND